MARQLNEARALGQMMLFHFSENPNIRVFEPRESRPLPGLPEGKPLVWAIDEWHSPMYFFPRECPRVLLWPVANSSHEDVDKWMGSGDFRMTAFVEEAWLPSIKACQLYRYSFEGAPFTELHDAGMHITRSGVEPLDVEHMGYLPERLMTAKVDLRPVESLQPLADARLWESSLHFSGIRLRNARDWVVSD